MNRLLASIIGSTVGTRQLSLMRITLAICAFGKALIVLPELVKVSEHSLRLPIVWLPQLPAAGLILIWLLGSVALLFGIAVPLSAAMIALPAWYTLLFDERLYGNHLVLLAVLATLLATTNGGRLRSPSSRVPGLSAFLMMTQITSVYLFAAIGKLNSQFLSGEVLLSELDRPGALITMPQAVLNGPLIIPLSISAVVIEFALGLALWSARARPVAILIGVGMHASFYALLPGMHPEFLIFGLLSVSTYPLFTTWRRAPLPAGNEALVQPS